MTPSRRAPLTGMTAFWLVWIGQVLSLLGSNMTQFGLTIWVYQQTGSATVLALIGVFYTAPMILMLPLVGVLVDRYDRKLMMMLSDLAAGVVSIGFFSLYAAGQLQVWHIYAGALINGVFNGFQMPAYMASISLMLPKEHYVRANSLLEIVGPGSNIVAPILAGAILGLSEAAGQDGLRLILLIDIVSFSAAIGSLLLIHVPNPPRAAESSEQAARGRLMGFLKEVIYGVRYIMARRPLLWLVLGFTFSNLIATLGSNTLLAPMLLARTNSNEPLFGLIQAIGSVGFVLGGVIVGAWGGFKRRIYGVLLAWVLFHFFTGVITGLGRAEPAWMVSLWAAGLFFGLMVVPLANGSVRAIIQAKVDPGVQGRVLSSTRFVAWITIPVASLISGMLADNVLEPAMQEGSALAPIFGPIVGAGPGAGMSLIVVLAGVAGTLLGVIMCFVPPVRHVERLLPDRVETPPDAAQAEGAPAR